MKIRASKITSRATFDRSAVPGRERDIFATTYARGRETKRERERERRKKENKRREDGGEAWRKFKEVRRSARTSARVVVASRGYGESVSNDIEHDAGQSRYRIQSPLPAAAS